MAVVTLPKTPGTHYNSPWTGLFVRPAKLLTQGAGGTVFSFDKREYVHEYHVWTYARLDQAWVRQSPGLPADWSFYTYSFVGPDGNAYTVVDDVCVLVEKTVKRKEDDSDGFHHWVVTCRYSTDVPDTKNDFTDNPTKNPCRLEWDPETYTGPMDKDLDGRPFLNAALQPFTPTSVFEHGRACCVITNVMWAGAVTAELIEKWSFVVNKTTFLGEEPGRWLMLPMRCEPKYVGRVLYFRCTRRLRLAGRNPVTGEKYKWDYIKLLNQGVCRLQNDPAKEHYRQPIPIIRGGVPITQPVFLTASDDVDNNPGQPKTGEIKLALGGLAGGTAYDKLIIEPTYETFRVRGAVDFGDVFKNSDGMKQVIPTNDNGPAWLEGGDNKDKPPTGTVTYPPTPVNPILFGVPPYP